LIERVFSPCLSVEIFFSKKAGTTEAQRHRVLLITGNYLIERVFSQRL